MAEYIERKRAIVDARNALELYPSEYARLEDALNRVPAADVAPVVHGRWVRSEIPEEEFCCSECGGAAWYYDVNKGIGKSGFCPNCGAKMDGDQPR